MSFLKEINFVEVLTFTRWFDNGVDFLLLHFFIHFCSSCWCIFFNLKSYFSFAIFLHFCTFFEVSWFTTCTSSLTNGGVFVIEDNGPLSTSDDDDDNGELFGEFEMGLLRLFLISNNLSLVEQESSVGSFSFPRPCPNKIKFSLFEKHYNLIS